VSTESTVTAKAPASGKMTVDDLREFLAELDKAGANGGTRLTARVSFGGWVKQMSVTVRHP
jgi:hypothetical protein